MTSQAAPVRTGTADVRHSGPSHAVGTIRATNAHAPPKWTYSLAATERTSISTTATGSATQGVPKNGATA